MPYGALIIANYIIAKCNEKELSISNLRLQKIMYYVQGYFLRAYNECAFDSNIFNWPYGPVVPDVYFEYCVYGSSEIHFENELIEAHLNKIKERKHRKLIDEIIEKCSQYTPGGLINLTHSEKPWKETNRSDLISNSKIMDYFEQNNPLDIKGI